MDRRENGAENEQPYIFKKRKVAETSRLLFMGWPVPDFRLDVVTCFWANEHSSSI